MAGEATRPGCRLINVRKLAESDALAAAFFK
jgi:hypothetical protein